MKDKRTSRRHGVLVKLNDAEHRGLEFLRDRESLPKAQVLRRLLIREVRAASEPNAYRALQTCSAALDAARKQIIEEGR